MPSVVVIAARSKSCPDVVGYGRDADEASAHAGLARVPEDIELFEVTVRDQPDDKESAVVASAVCGYHITEDEEVPEAVKQEMRDHIAEGRFAAAVDYCFEAVWDRGFEAELPPEGRKYT